MRQPDERDDMKKNIHHSTYVWGKDSTNFGVTIYIFNLTNAIGIVVILYNYYGNNNA